MNYVPKHSRDHAHSEYVSYVRVDHKRAEFIGNKQIDKLKNKQTYKHSTLYISTDMQHSHDSSPQSNIWY